MAENKTSISKELISESNESNESIEVIYESINNNNKTVNKLNDSSVKMNTNKFWRPFETPMDVCPNGCPPERDTSDGKHSEGKSTQYTFDLNHQNSRPIAYLTTDSRQLVISSTIPQHLCGNILVNTHERTHPYLTSLLQSPPKYTNRFVAIQPKPTNFENRLNLPKERNAFKCEFNGCGKSFRFKSALQNHLLVHSDERKFCCGLCGKRYKQLSGLYSHESVKHLGKTKKFVCDSCGESFVDYRNLRIHEYNQHESDEFAKFVTRALEKPSAGLDYSTDHHSDDSNHSH